MLNAHDRCDKCGAQALVKVRSVYTLKELLFCGHHATAFESALDVAGFNVVSRQPVEPPKTPEPEPA